jgi:hypothetical protein
MEIRNNTGLIESLLARANNNASQGSNNARPAPPPPQTTQTRDIVRVPENLGASLKSNASKLVSEEVEKLENGFRRTQVFETPQGGKFTRIEEQTTSDDRSKRIVIQQNDSGNTTILENILDRQEDGSFRQTQRFTDEAGETSTNIEFNVNGQNFSQLAGLPPSPSEKPPNPFDPSRGTQINIVT